MNVQRILLTGATGYVGSRVAAHFAEDPSFHVTVLVRPTSSTDLLKPVLAKISVELVGDGPASIETILKRAKPDVVVHLASSAPSATPNQSVKDVVSANILFGTELLQAMLTCGVKNFVNTGTFWEEMGGDGVYRPLDFYAATKRAFQNILRYYEDAHDFRAVTLKLFGVYGPRDPRPKVFALFKRATTSAEPIGLSPGKQELDLVYVDDVANAFIKAASYVAQKSSPITEVFEIGSGVCTPLQEIAKIYEQCSGAKLNVRWATVPYRPREVMRSCANIASAKEKLDWKPQHDLKSGISQMLKQETAASASL